MTNALRFIGPRVPLVDVRTGVLTREGLLWLQAVWVRTGGATGPSTTELQVVVDDLAPLAPTDAGIEAALLALADAAQQAPALELPPLPDDQAPAPLPALPPDDPSAELSALREELQVLRQRVHDLEQRP
jgi:hypothetical protein